MKKEYDLHRLRKRAGKTQSDPSATKVPISIRLDGGVLASLRTEARSLGIPCQTFVGSILHRYVHHELIDRSSAELQRLLKRAP